MPLTQQLTDMAALLSIVGAPGTAQPGQALQLGLAPPISPINFTEFVDKDLSLDFIAKQVMFTNKNFAAPGWIDDKNIAKILPFFTLTPPIAADPSGVPGLVGKLTGKLPVPVPSTAAPTIAVQWVVTDDANNVLAQGTDFLAPNGLANPTLDITFLPEFARFEGVTPAATGRKITAKVTLSAGVDSAQRDIGPIRILIPVIPFPKVLALTLHTNFQGAALIMVPGVSAINNIDHIRALLQPVRNVISTLTSVARFAEMLIGIDTLSGILDATNIEFRKANSVGNLNNITLIQRPWYENDTEAEDELSAFVYISPPPPGRVPTDNQVEMCNARSLGTSEGKFTVNTGISFVAICPSLHSGTPAVSPSNAVRTVNNAPAGWRPFHNITSFGDELSSINFL